MRLKDIIDSFEKIISVFANASYAFSSIWQDILLIPGPNGTTVTRSLFFLFLRHNTCLDVGPNATLCD